MPDMNENAETQQEYLGRCHDCTAPQTEVNILSRHILELQNDKGKLIDRCRDLEAQIEKIRVILCEYSCLDEKTKHYIDVVIKEIKENDLRRKH